MTNRKRTIAVALAAAAALGGTTAVRAEPLQLLNVSYDPTRELWKDLNEQFAKAYQQKAGVTLDVKQSHGGSSAQARGEHVFVTPREVKVFVHDYRI